MKQLKTDIWNLKWAIVMIIAVLTLLQVSFGSMCPLVIIAKFPCPACGMTRAGLCLLRGDLFGALKYNAMIYLWGSVLLWMAWMRYVRKRDITYATYIWIIVLVITIGYYIIRLINGIIL